MYCPKCGAENPDTNLICENCSFPFAKEPQPETTKETNSFSKEIISETIIPAFQPKKPVVKPSGGKVAAYGLWGTAFFVLVLSVIGAISVFYGGNAIANIRTVVGNTLEETFFRRLQPVYAGFGFFILAVGIFLSSLLAFLGFHQHQKAKTAGIAPAAAEEPEEENNVQPVL